MEKLINLNGKEVAYLDNEKSSDVTFLFIHGNSLAKEIFLPLFDEESLSKFRLIAIDLPGHGNSDAWDSYSVPKLSDFCTSFIQFLNLKNIILVGHSLGGHIGLRIADKVHARNLIAIGTPLIDRLEAFALAYKNPEALALFSKNELTRGEAIRLSSLIGLEGDDGSMALKTDKKFRASLIDSVVNGGDPMEAQLWHGLTCRKNVLIALDDSLVNSELVSGEARKGEFIQLNAPCGHTPSISSPKMLAEIIIKLTLLD